jgi:UDP-N-acetylmuramoyl-L-alanyl-D-glutamate--2,6-diaminopimelate ligase
MKLGEVLERVPRLAEGVDANAEVTSLAYDSRHVERGSLFFAIHGEKADGHDYIAEALERGAVGVVSERPAPELSSRWIQVPKIRRALSEAARSFYHHPDSQLRLIGITGTNGKTTTAFLLESILRAAGICAGLFGTIEHRFGRRTVKAVNTTPESLDLMTWFDDLVRSGGQAAVLEVSSHALAQERVWGFQFAAAVFTNLTRDHLDYHKDFESYFAAKRRLFEGLGARPPELAVINADDEWGDRLLKLSGSRQLTYGTKPGAQVRVKQSSSGLAGIKAVFETPSGTLDIVSPLVGQTNLLNILAATATALGLGIAADRIRDGIEALAAVPGRFERIEAGQPFLVVVDYAHTDDALRNVLRVARELTENRLLVVFGCGGERDRTKRPLMGEAAGLLADFAYLTSDNPRSEDPLEILNDVIVGLQRTGRGYRAEVDRKAAIRKALGDAREGDVVVLAGKGHETYQILKDRTIPFDDREVAREVLRELGYPSPGEPDQPAPSGRNSKRNRR